MFQTPETTSEKPIVSCVLLQSPEDIAVGYSAIVLPSSHPNHIPGHDVSNKSPVRTSRVVAFDLEARRFETLNTIYQWDEKPSS